MMVVLVTVLLILMCERVYACAHQRLHVCTYNSARVLCACLSSSLVP